MKAKKELLKSEWRKWDDTTRLYDVVLFVQSGLKHDSGYMCITLMGMWRDGDVENFEILGQPDDVSLIVDPLRFGDKKEFVMSPVRMDCYYPQGVFQYHGRGGKFKVSEALSSMEITYIPKD